MTHRKRRDSNIWHWRSNCSKFPRKGYEQVSKKPKSGEFCKECQAKDKNSKK